ncbi:type II secretion system protein, partial [Vibrio metschnikovii]|nr:type II secretion system protein [Vibrio metschnikovii]
MVRGFTLMEMVIAIILLGIVGLFLGNVAGQAMGIAATSSSREALIQQGRFITERLSREIREAVPNSVIVENNCIEFLPIINSGIYSQLANNTEQLKFLPLKKQNLLQGDRLVVFPTQAQPLRQSLSDSAPPRQVAQLANDVSITTENRAEIEVPLTRQ